MNGHYAIDNKDPSAKVLNNGNPQNFQKFYADGIYSADETGYFIVPCQMVP
jgi:hypothetical protein